MCVEKVKYLVVPVMDLVSLSISVRLLILVKMVVYVHLMLLITTPVIVLVTILETHVKVCTIVLACKGN